MAAEATAQSSGSQFSVGQSFVDNIAYQIGDAVDLKYRLAREISNDEYEALKASIA